MRRALVTMIGTLVAASAFPTSALAQAWVAPAGLGSLTWTFEEIENTGHRVDDGVLQRNGQSRNAAVDVDLDYAFTDRLSFAVSVPYVFSRFLDRNTATDGAPPPQPVDLCFCWQHAWQDLGATARFNLSNGAFGLTPSVSFGAPTHNYETHGEAVVGRGLSELTLAVDAGRRLDALSPSLTVSGRYEYAVVERVPEFPDVPNNRSRISTDVAYTPRRHLSTHLTLAWQRTHGGLRVADLMATPVFFDEHDRLLRDNNFHLAGGVDYQLGRIEIFGSFLGYVSGTDTHAGRAIIAGVSLPFELAR